MLVDSRNFRQQSFCIRREPARLPAADFLQTIRRPHPDNFIVAEEQLKELRQPPAIRQHKFHQLFRAAQGAWISAGQQLLELPGFRLNPIHALDVFSLLHRSFLRIDHQN